MNAFVIVFGMVVTATIPAFADIKTVCQGGGQSGQRYRVELVHVESIVGSKSDKATMNGTPTKSTLLAYNGIVGTFSLEGVAHVWTLDYNQGEATARLAGAGLNPPVKMFCSRY